jgi:predicted phosphodiesterase
MNLETKNKIWLGLSAFATIYFAAFLALIFLIRPFWSDTNSFLTWALGIEFNWVIIVIILSSTLILFHFSSFNKTIKNRGKEENTLNLATRISIPLTLIIWIGMTILLLSELGREQSIILINSLNSLPGIMTALYLLLVILLLPRFSYWQNKKVRITVLAATALLALIIASKPGSIKITAGPYLQAPSEDSITVMWTTNRQAISWVEYGENFEYKAYPQHDGLVDMKEKVQKVELTGLAAGKQYPYRVVSKEIKKFFPYSVSFGKTAESEDYSFSTLDSKAENISFLVINDLHERHEYWADIAEELKTDPVDFVVLNGDYFNDLNGERQLINSLIKPVTKYFASEIPFILIRGNHETRGILARSLRDYIALPEDKYYFSFAHGPVAMLAIDSGEDKEDDHKEYSGMVAFDEYRKEETRWLKETVQRQEWQDASWRIAFSHIPLNQFALDEEEGEYKAEILGYQNTWTAMLGDGNLDLMLSGHTHRWKIHESSDEVSFPLIIGGGLIEGTEDFVVIRVDADAASLKVDLRNQHGKSFYEYKTER